MPNNSWSGNPVPALCHSSELDNSSRLCGCIRPSLLGKWFYVLYWISNILSAMHSVVSMLLFDFQNQFHSFQILQGIPLAPSVFTLCFPLRVLVLIICYKISEWYPYYA